MAEKKVTPVVKKVAPKTDSVAKPVVKAVSKFELPVMDLNGKEVGKVILPENVFGVEVNEALLSQAIRVYTANTHQGTQSTKTRAEVRGGGRKPWKQKGTGRARQGSIRSPQWRGGGVTFGPKPHDPGLDMPVKMRRAALKSALSSRLGDLVIFEGLSMKEPKTAKIVTALHKLGLSGKTLMVVSEYDQIIVRASRNIGTLRLTQASDLNALEVVAATKLLLSKDSITKLAEVSK